MKLAMEIGLGPGHIALDRNPAPTPQRGTAPPQFSVHVCCGQTAGWIKMPLGTEVGLGPGLIVLDGDPAPPQQRGQSPHNFRPMSIMAKWLDGSRCHLVGTKVGVGPGNTVLDGDPSTPKGAHWHSAPFLAHACCGQMAELIKKPLGTEMGHSPGDIVLHGDPAPPPRKRHSPSTFRPCLLWPNGWMDQAATWYGFRPRPRPCCVRWGPSSPQRGTSLPPIFGPCLLWPTVAHLSYC